jgi:hypothetical protein
MRSEVLTAVKMPILIRWVVTPCGLVGRHRLCIPPGGSTFLRNVELVGRYQRFGGTYCLNLEG